MNKTLRSAFIFSVWLILMPTGSWAITIDLGFGSLPSTQGWLYQGQVPETTVFTVDGTTLTMNSLGQGDIAPVYFMANIIDPSLPFTVFVRARVTATDAASSLPFAFVSFTGTEIFQAILGLDTIRIQGQDFSLDNTQFHDFRFDAVPGIGSHFFVDNNLLASFQPLPSPVFNSILFGDGNGFPNSNGAAEITRFTFTQDSVSVPEPATLLLLGSGMAGLIALRRKFPA